MTEHSTDEEVVNENWHGLPLTGVTGLLLERRRLWLLPSESTLSFSCVEIIPQCVIVMLIETIGAQ